MTLNTLQLFYSVTTVSGIYSNLLNLVNRYNDRMNEQLRLKDSCHKSTTARMSKI